MESVKPIEDSSIKKSVENLKIKSSCVHQSDDCVRSTFPKMFSLNLANSLTALPKGQDSTGNRKNL